MLTVPRGGRTYTSCGKEHHQVSDVAGKRARKCGFHRYPRMSAFYDRCSQVSNAAEEQVS